MFLRKKKKTGASKKNEITWTFISLFCRVYRSKQKSTLWLNIRNLFYVIMWKLLHNYCVLK